MQTLEAIRGRRSIRGFTADRITDEELDTLVEAAAAAPSGGNAQPWVFLSIREARRVAAVRSLAPGIVGSPAAVIVLCADERRRGGGGPELEEMASFDLGAAMENILLAAHDMGLGSCAIGSFDGRALSVFLDLPQFLKPRLLVAVGRPKSIPQAPQKRALAELYHKERYMGRP